MAQPALSDALALLRRYRDRHDIAAHWVPSAAGQAAALAIRHLLPADLVWHLDGHDLLARLDSGDVLVLGMQPDMHVNGHAVRAGLLRRASINEGAARAVFELAAALWSDPSFLPEIGPTERLMSTSNDTLAVPRGMEFVSRMARTHFSVSKVGDVVPAPAWLTSTLHTMAGQRRHAFERTVWNALRFLLLHELGHVCLGHLELSAGRQRYLVIDELRGRGDDGSQKTSRWTDPALRAFEIEADRFAATNLFLEARQRDEMARAHPTAMSATALALLGATLVPIVFHAMQMFSDKPESLSAHPPLWFRADAVMRAALPRSTTAVDLDAPLSQWAAGASYVHLLVAAGKTHPLLGQWLGPVIDGDLEGPAARVLAEARFARDGLLQGRPRRHQHVVAPSRAEC